MKTQNLELSEKRKKDRAQMVWHVTALCDEHRIEYEVEDGWLGNPRCTVVHIRAPHGLALSLDFDGASIQPDTFVLSWHFDSRGHDNEIRLDPDYWGRDHVNLCHGRKATDVCHGFEQLLYCLGLRFKAINNGKAYLHPEPCTS